MRRRGSVPRLVWAWLHKRPLARLLLLAAILVICLRVTTRLVKSLPADGLGEVKSLKTFSGQEDPGPRFRRLSQNLGDNVMDGENKPVRWMRAAAGDSQQEMTQQKKSEILAEILGPGGDQPLPPVSAILTLRNFESGFMAVEYLRGVIRYLPDTLVTDVIIIADLKTKESDREFIEDAVDSCEACRIFFLSGTVYENFNFIVNFAHHDFLVFLDCRVQLSEFWLEPMLAKVMSDPRLLVSPHIRLTTTDGSEVSQGVYRTEVTWDLGVVRGVDDRLLRLVQSRDPLFIDQSALSKQAFMIRKDIFNGVGRFDVIPYTSGIEDAAFSMKMLNCGGNILQSRLSVVYFPAPRTSLPPSEYRMQPDILSPTFAVPEANMTSYMTTTAKLWQDNFSLQFFACTAKGKIPVSKNRRTNTKRNNVFTSFNRYGILIKRDLVDMKCKLANFRYLLIHRQPKTTTPDKSSTHFGYIRTLDSLYAFGLPDPLSNRTDVKVSQDEQTTKFVTENFVLTRNSSLWLGPVSYANGNVIFKNKFCLTRTSEDFIRLVKCSVDDKHQKFVFERNVLKISSDPAKCVGAERSGNISTPLRLVHCDSKAIARKFKFDEEFLENCLK